MSYIARDVNATSSAASGGPDWGALATTGASVPSITGSGGSGLKGALSALDTSRARNTDLAKMFTDEGQHLLQPLAEYLKAVTGPDRQAAMQATMPERRRVIDQYATAKKAIAEFTPRGGGQAGSLNQINADQAGALSDIGANARKEGFNQLGQLGMQQMQLGQNAEAIASGDLNALIQSLTQQQESSANRWMEVGKAAGAIAAIYFTGGAAAPAVAAAL